MEYVIHSKSERGFWSNVFGWVYSVKEATIFTNTDYSLPMTIKMDAEWMPVKYDE